MSSSKQKKVVHYERGTKGGKSSQGHRSSRDSGVGSSSASDRASLGTNPDDGSSFNYQQIQGQRYNLNAVQEALDAANETIRQLEADNAKLNKALTDSNKENRLLKKEKAELLNKVDFLMDDLRDEKKRNERFKREATPRTGVVTSSTRTDRRATPPDSSDRRYRRGEEGLQGSHGEQRSSWRETTYEMPPPTAPQPPYNSSPNPFTPISERASSVSYSPTTVTYAPAAVSYTTAPAFPPSSTSGGYPNDGRYHPFPV